MSKFNSFNDLQNYISKSGDKNIQILNILSTISDKIYILDEYYYAKLNNFLDSNWLILSDNILTIINKHIISYDSEIRDFFNNINTNNLKLSHDYLKLYKSIFNNIKNVNIFSIKNSYDFISAIEQEDSRIKDLLLFNNKFEQRNNINNVDYFSEKIKSFINISYEDSNTIQTYAFGDNSDYTITKITDYIYSGNINKLQDFQEYKSINNILNTKTIINNFDNIDTEYIKFDNIIYTCYKNTNLFFNNLPTQIESSAKKSKIYKKLADIVYKKFNAKELSNYLNNKATFTVQLNIPSNVLLSIYDSENIYDSTSIYLNANNRFVKFKNIFNKTDKVVEILTDEFVKSKLFTFKPYRFITDNTAVRYFDSINYNIYIDDDIIVNNINLQKKGFLDFLFNLTNLNFNYYNLEETPNIEIYGISPNINLATENDVKNLLNNDKNIDNNIKSNIFVKTNMPIIKIGNKFHYIPVSSSIISSLNFNDLISKGQFTLVDLISDFTNTINNLNIPAEEKIIIDDFINKYSKVQQEELKNDIRLYFVIYIKNVNKNFLLELKQENNEFNTEIYYPFTTPKITGDRYYETKTYQFDVGEKSFNTQISGYVDIRKNSYVKNFSINNISVISSFDDSLYNINKITLSFLGLDVNTNTYNNYNITVDNTDSINIYDYIPSNVVVEDRLYYKVDLKINNPIASTIGRFYISIQSNLDQYYAQKSIIYRLYTRVNFNEIQTRLINIYDDSFNLQYGKTISEPLDLKIGLIQNEYQRDYPDSIKLLLAENAFNAKGDRIDISSFNLDSTIANQIDIINSAEYLTDFKSIFIKPLTRDFIGNKYIRLYVKFYLNSDNTDLIDLQYLNAYNIDLTSYVDNSYILFAEGKLSDYTTGMQLEEIFKVYKILLNLHGKNQTPTTAKIPIFIDFDLRVYDDYTSYVNYVDSTNYYFNDAIYINYIAANEKLVKSSYWTPKILNTIEYDDIYGINPKDYIYNLYCNVRTLDNVIVKPSELYFDTCEFTKDIQFAIPEDYSNATADEFENLNVKYFQTQNEEIILDALNIYLRKKCSNCDAVGLKLTIKIVPNYYGLNEAGIAFGDYIKNTKFSFIIPYIFYKKSANAIIPINKKSKIVYDYNLDLISASMSDSDFTTIKNKILDIALTLQYPDYKIQLITDATSFKELYNNIIYNFNDVIKSIVENSIEKSLPVKSDCYYTLFNSSIINKTLDFKVSYNNSGKITRISDFTMTIAPLEFLITTITENINYNDYTTTDSGLIKIDVYDSQIYIDSIYLPIPSYDYIISIISKIIDQLTSVILAHKNVEPKERAYSLIVVKDKPEEIVINESTNRISIINSTDLEKIINIKLNYEHKMPLDEIRKYENILADKLEKFSFPIAIKVIRNSGIIDSIEFYDCKYETTDSSGNTVLSNNISGYDYIPVMVYCTRKDINTLKFTIDSQIKVKFRNINKDSIDLLIGDPKKYLDYYISKYDNFVGINILNKIEFKRISENLLKERLYDRELFNKFKTTIDIIKNFGVLQNKNINFSSTNLRLLNDTDDIKILEKEGLIYKDKYFGELYALLFLKLYIKKCKGNLLCVWRKIHDQIIGKNYITKFTLNLNNFESNYRKISLLYDNIKIKNYLFEKKLLKNEDNIVFMESNTTYSLYKIGDNININNYSIVIDDVYSKSSKINESIDFYYKNYDKYFQTAIAPLSLNIKAGKATVVQASDFKEIYNAELEISKNIISYVNIRKIKFLTDFPEAKIILSSKETEELYIIDNNKSFNINLNIDEYSIKSAGKYDIKIFGIPNKTGSYKAIIYLEYEYLGKIYTTKQIVHIDVVLPDALDNNQIEVYSNVLDAPEYKKSENNKCGQDIDVRQYYLYGGRGTCAASDKFDDSLLTDRVMLDDIFDDFNEL